MRKTLITTFILLIAAGVFAQNRLTPEGLWDLARVSDPQISPDGKSVLYGITNYDLKANKGNRDLHLVPVLYDPENPSSGLSGRGKSQDLTRLAAKITDWDGSEWNARWRPDGKKIGFLSAKENGAQLWEIDPNGDNPRRVTDIEGGISNFAYSPTGKHISFTIDVKLDKTVNDIYPDLPEANARIMDDLMYRHWNQWHDYKYSHVCLAEYNESGMIKEYVDIMQSEPYDSPLNPFGGDEQIAWSPDGNVVVYVCKKVSGKKYAVSTNSDLYLYDITSGKTTNLTEGMMGFDNDPVFSPDGSKLAWSSMARDGYESDKNRLFIMDMASAKKEDYSVNFDESMGHVRWKGEELIYFTAVKNAEYQIFELNLANKNVRPVTKGMHNYYGVEVAGDMLIGNKCSMSAPIDLYRVDPVTGDEYNITEANKARLLNTKMGKVEKRMIKTSDGKEMLTWVIYPPDFDPKKKYPTLLYCQGGPQSAVSQFFSFRWNFQLMAANDYIIVAPNRRGLPGFGQKWNEDISGDWGGQPMRDYLAAIDEVKKEPFVDESRLGAVGASYGGYSVYYLAGIHEKRFKTFISHCGLFNLESWYGTTEEMFFANYDIGGPYWAKTPPKSYAKFSPHKFVQNWDTPILVIHNEKDFRVPLGEGMQAFQAAQLQDVPSRFLYFPDEGHWVLGPQNGIVWHRVFFEWLDKWLKK